MPQNPNLDDLVFKTMPRAKAYPKASPASLGVPSDAPAAPAVQPEHSILPEERGSRGKLKKIVIIFSIVILAVLVIFAVYFFFIKKDSKSQQDNVQKTSSVSVQSQIGKDWMSRYFNVESCNDLTVCGDDADPDHDGLTNLQEFKGGTDPNNFDSDTDGLADGDEINIFGTDPTSSHTGNDPKYSDADEAKAQWNIKEGRKYSDAELAVIREKVQQYGFHQPTITTLGDIMTLFYTKAPVSTQGSTSSPGSVDPQALDRDIQRSDAIKQIGFALLAYKDANKSYPNTTDFAAMIKAVKPFMTGVAVNTTDPKNQAPYVYSYKPFQNDFQLGYYSETQGQAITIMSPDIQKARVTDQQTMRDEKRMADLKDIAAALELYANDHQDAYPKQTEWKSALGSYINSIPTDPKTNADYAYTSSSDQVSFAVQAQLEAPPSGKKGFVCTQDNCSYY